MSASTRYDEDVAAWAEEQAALLRAGQLDRLDLMNLAEETPTWAKASNGRWQPC
jgi:hypothetical protein